MKDDLTRPDALHHGSSTVPVELTDDLVRCGGFGTPFPLRDTVARNAYALSEHSLMPGLLGAPPHLHTNEDEVSYILNGERTVWREGALSVVRPGSIIVKPRGKWHT